MDLYSETMKIVIAEESGSLSWPQIGELCDGIIFALNDSEQAHDVPNEIYQYLEDWDIRRKDAVYANWQRQKVKRLIG